MKHCYEDIPGYTKGGLLETYQEIVGGAPDHAHFVEVGAFCGRSTVFMIVEIINSKKEIRLDTVDIWKGNSAQLFKENLEKRQLTPYCFAIQKTSAEASALYKNETLDFVFLDADHSYESMKEDIELWFPKVKIGGIIGGHDYGRHSSTVARAVDEKFTREELRFIGRCWLHTKKE